MVYTTYFEVGGQVVESYVEPVASPRPAANPLIGMAKEKGLSKRDVKVLNESLKQDTGLDFLKIGDAYGRGRRARWAMMTALTLAAADGPLPVGDIVAIGFLTSYAVYESAMVLKDVKEGAGY